MSSVVLVVLLHFSSYVTSAWNITCNCCHHCFFLLDFALLFLLLLYFLHKFFHLSRWCFDDNLSILKLAITYTYTLPYPNLGISMKLLLPSGQCNWLGSILVFWPTFQQKGKQYSRGLPYSTVLHIYLFIFIYIPKYKQKEFICLTYIYINKFLKKD